MKIEKQENEEETGRSNGSGKYSLLDHMQRFSTNEACIKYLVEKRWNGSAECRHCGNDQGNYFMKTRLTYKCRSCRKQFSVLHDTMFYRTSVDLTKWFCAIYHFLTCKKGISCYQMAKMLGVNKDTAWRMMQKMREALRDAANFQLTGDVESDDTEIRANTSLDLRVSFSREGHLKKMEEKYGPTKESRRAKGKVLKRGRKKGDTAEVLAKRRKDKMAKEEKEGKRITFGEVRVIQGMIERGKNGRLVLAFIGRNKSKAYSLSNMRKFIQGSSRLFTDGDMAFKDAKEMFREHRTIVKRREIEIKNKKTGKTSKRRYFKYVEDGRHTNTIENVWKHLKAQVRGTHIHISTKHTQRYLDEFTFKWNHRQLSQQELFDSFFDHVVGKYITVEQLINSTVIRIAA